MRVSILVLVTCLLALPVHAQYSGGSGTADDPYEIATAADLIALGETPDDYDKHFVLTADIDLHPNLPGAKVFDKAVVAAHAGVFGWPFSGTPFSGVFDGRDYAISNLTIVGSTYLGLFGQLTSGAEVKNVRMVRFNIDCSEGHSGGLVGLVGSGTETGAITNCSCDGMIRGSFFIGGLVGYNAYTDIIGCYSVGVVDGAGWSVGGLVGYNIGSIMQCYSAAAVTGGSWVGGLVGENAWDIIECYSTGAVQGTSSVGGLVGHDYFYSEASQCFWDTQTSGQTWSAGGTGKTTAQMQIASTFLDAGWDFTGETANGTDDIWWIDEGVDYPRLSWELELEPVSAYGGGAGEPNNPYLIYTAEQLNAIGAYPGDWDKHFKLMADIDLSGYDGRNGRPAFNQIAPATGPFAHYEADPFKGVLDGSGHTISNLTVVSAEYVGLIGVLENPGQVRGLGLVDVDMCGQNQHTGAFVGYSYGTLKNCYSTGRVTGDSSTGGLVGYNRGEINCSYSECLVVGVSFTGGLVGDNWSNVIDCYSAGVVQGSGIVPSGGLVGLHHGSIIRCYSSCVGQDGGLVGSGGFSEVLQSFWDMDSSGQDYSAGGTGLTTAEMQTASTYLDAGWDFVGETANGTDDIWRMPEEPGYPLLAWQDVSADEGEDAISIEDFETGDLATLPWQHPGDVPWIVTSQQCHAGEFSAQAGAISNGQISSLAVTVTCVSGQVSFWQKVSCHSSLASLGFLIDGELVDAWSGRKEWEAASFPVSGGTHTFTWTYSKVGWSSMGEDTAWIDDIAFPVQ